MEKRKKYKKGRKKEGTGMEKGGIVKEEGVKRE